MINRHVARMYTPRNS